MKCQALLRRNWKPNKIRPRQSNARGAGSGMKPQFGSQVPIPGLCVDSDRRHAARNTRFIPSAPFPQKRIARARRAISILRQLSCVQAGIRRRLHPTMPTSSASPNPASAKEPGSGTFTVRERGRMKSCSNPLSMWAMNPKTDMTEKSPLASASLHRSQTSAKAAFWSPRFWFTVTASPGIEPGGASAHGPKNTSPAVGLTQISPCKWAQSSPGAGRILSAVRSGLPVV